MAHLRRVAAGLGEAGGAGGSGAGGAAADAAEAGGATARGRRGFSKWAAWSSSFGGDTLLLVGVLFYGKLKGNPLCWYVLVGS